VSRTLPKVAPLVLVQVLRGLAALLVVAGHTQGQVINNARATGSRWRR
jgi:peptidoglycan/LPS O-acetylase OafA/YrhL